MLELLTRPYSPKEIVLIGILSIVVPTVVILTMSLFPAGSKFLSEILGVNIE
ncbi:MAG: hypothetical protein ACM3X4_06470 [Ignavibacteriales bacterium]